MIAAADELAPAVGVARACRVLGVSRASLYRRRRPRPVAEKGEPSSEPSRRFEIVVPLPAPRGREMVATV